MKVPQERLELFAFTPSDMFVICRSRLRISPAKCVMFSARSRVYSLDLIRSVWDWHSHRRNFSEAYRGRGWLRRLDVDLDTHFANGRGRVVRHELPHYLSLHTNTVPSSFQLGRYRGRGAVERRML